MPLGVHPGDRVASRVPVVLAPRVGEALSQRPVRDRRGGQAHVEAELAETVVHEHVLADVEPLGVAAGALEGLADTWRQYYRYARGDAIAGMYPERHALRFGAYSAALWAWSTKGAVRKLATLAGAGAYASTPLRRAAVRFADPADRARAMVTVPALMAVVDSAKMAGYLAGLWKRRSHRSGPVELG